MSGVVRLVPNLALCADQVQIAERLHRLADLIAAGEFPEVERVCVVIDQVGGLQDRVYGRPTTNMELVGMLQWAQHQVMKG